VQPSEQALRLIGKVGITLGLAAVIASCSGDVTRPPPSPAELLSVAGDGQSGPAGEILPLLLIVEVLDASGSPVSGATVRFAPGTGSGQALPASVVTTSTGRAETNWLLGTDASIAQVMSASAGAVSVEFTATALPATASQLLPFEGNQQNGRPGEVLDRALQVRLSDRFGNPVGNQSVQWRVTIGGGALDVSTGVTDAAGLTQAQWTLGAGEGLQIVTAEVPGVGTTLFIAQALPLDLAGSAIVVDSTVTDVVSDSLERATGIYRFQSTVGQLPEVQPGDVLVGTANGGYLRRVETVSVNGSELSAMTSQAALDEIVEGGSLSFTFDFTSSVPQPARSVALGALRTTYLADGASLAGALVDLSGFDLCTGLTDQSLCPSGVSLLIEDGTLTFDPSVNADVDFGPFRVDNFHAIATGIVGLDVAVRASSSRSFDIAGEKQVFEVKRYWSTSALGGEGVLRVFLGFEASAGATGTLTTGYEASQSVSVGATYDRSTGWQSVFETVPTREAHPTEWDASASAHVRLYIRPEVEVLLYTVAGPRIGLEPYLAADGDVTQSAWNLEVAGGIDAELGFRVKILSYTLADFTTSLTGPRWVIYQADGEIFPAPTIVTESLPSGTVGQAYSQTLEASGGKTPYLWSLDAGSPPSGLSLGSDGAISGVPTVAGSADFRVRVTADDGKSDTADLSITVGPEPQPPTIVTSSLPDGTVGEGYSQTLQASGGQAPYSWSIASGSLPSGLTLTSGGVISGTPSTQGLSSFTVRVTDNDGLSSTQGLSIDVDPTPQAPPDAAPNNLSAGLFSSNQINLAWTDNSTNEDGFHIERCAGTSCTNFVQIATTGSNVTTYQNTGLATNTAYRYRVRAYNPSGNSGYSNLASAGSLSFTPTADAVAFSYIPDDNFGSGSVLAVEHNTAAGYHAASLVRFDLSSLPANATIVQAYLELYCLTESGTVSLRVGRLAPSPAWDESGATGVTWNTMPYGTTPPGYSYHSVGCPNVWNLVPVQGFVQRWVSGTDFNNGFQLFTESDPTGASFYAREDSGARGPRLSVVYEAR